MDATGHEIRDAFIRACTLEELKAKGKMVVGGGRCPLLVIYDEGEVHALDNRCPHLGFPLHRGSVEDGILTCHWHHARFDIKSGARATDLGRALAYAAALRALSGRAAPAGQ